jgi:GTP-binding protein
VHERFTIADVPGIVEDAHLGKGLGLEFLRHVSRTRLLAFVLDAAADPLAHLASLRAELEAYEPLLLERPALIVLNKIDLIDAEAVDAGVELLAEYGLPVVPISAERGDGLSALVDALFVLLPDAPRPPAADTSKQVVAEPAMRVTRDESGLGWIVHGRELEAVVARFDPTNRDAVDYLQRHFLKLGVYKLLGKTGAKTGDDVRIGGAVFEYFDEAAAEAAAKAEEAAEAADEVAAERRYLAAQAALEGVAGPEDVDGADGEPDAETDADADPRHA